jgi:hypothetical protein
MDGLNSTLTTLQGEGLDLVRPIPVDRDLAQSIVSGGADSRIAASSGDVTAAIGGWHRVCDRHNKRDGFPPLHRDGQL